MSTNKTTIADNLNSKRQSLRPNNFDVIRLLAALQVVLFHGIEHLELESIGQL